MTISKVRRFALLCRLLILLSCKVGAWQQNVDNRKSYHAVSCDGSTNILLTEPSPRRLFLFQMARTTTIAAMTTIILPNQACVAAASESSADSARKQWKEAVSTLDDLLNDWSTVATNGGDAIRGKLGTQGTLSPLFQIDKALRTLRDSDYVDDFIEFQETIDDFRLALSRADAMAYSANFAGGSGKPTPPAVYIEKSKTEVIEIQRIAKKLDAMVK